MSAEETIADAIEGMRQVIKASSVNPETITLPPQPLHTMVKCSIAAALLVFVNRALFHPDRVAASLPIDIVSAATSLVFIFIISLAVSLVRLDDDGEKIANQWSLLSTCVWLVALFVCLMDGLIGRRLGTLIGEAAGGPLWRGIDVGFLITFFLYVTIAYLIILVRSILTKSFNSPLQAVLSFVLVVPLCTAMLYIFVFTN